MNYDDYEFYGVPDDYAPEYAMDSYFEEVQGKIKRLYIEKDSSTFFIRQLQVKFEKDYYHWITNNAVVGLYKIGYLKDIRISKEKGTSTRFFYKRTNRYPMRSIKRIEKIIEEYSRDHITRSCGHRAEDLFCNALAMRDFMPKAKKVRDFNGKKWEKSGHDLDFVFERDKNTIRL